MKKIIMCDAFTESCCLESLQLNVVVNFNGFKTETYIIYSEFWLHRVARVKNKDNYISYK